jgi:hypothetical protein
MRGTSECIGGGFLVADLDVDADIVRRLVPQGRGAGGDRIGGAHHHRQRLVGNIDQFGGILRRSDRLGDDECHRLADKACPVGRQRVMAGSDRRGTAQPRLDVGRRREPGIVRDRAEPGGKVVGAGQHSEHSRCGERRRLVHRDDAGMGIGRAHEAGLRLARQCDVVAEAAPAGQQAKILLAPHRLADAVRHSTRGLHAPLTPSNPPGAALARLRVAAPTSTRPGRSGRAARQHPRARPAGRC